MSYDDVVVPETTGSIALTARGLTKDFRGFTAVKDVDLDVLNTLDKSAVSYQIVLTKADELKDGALETRIAETQAAIKRRAAAFPVVQPTSSRAGLGVPELRATIARLLTERGA